MVERKRKIQAYAFWKKGIPFLKWREVLIRSNFSLKTFYKEDKLFEALLFKPPEVIFFYYEINPQAFQILVRDIKLHFNLVRLPVILIVDDWKENIFENNLNGIDEILTLQAKDEEVLIRTKLTLNRLERVSDNNPLTGLPGNVSIEKKIREALEAENPLAVIYADLDNFKAYNDLYGFARGDEMIKNLSKILVNTISSYSKESFVGHVGGDDFVLIVPLEKAEDIAKEVIQRFDSLIPKFVNPQDLKRGCFISKDRQGNFSTFPLPSITLSIVPVYKGKFKHQGEVAERAGQVKKIAKSIPGSAYFIDRRA